MMALLCLVCAALAVWWGVSPPRRQERLVDADEPAGEAVSRSARPERPVIGVLVSTSIVGVAVLLDGARGAVLGLTVLVIGWTGAALLRTHRRAGLVRRRQQEVARACAALSAQLRIGQVPSVALASAAGEHAVLRDARDAQDLGGDVVRVWRSQARHAGCAGLLELARAWQVSARTGAPMSASLEQVTAALMAEQDLRAVVAGELSAPRATGKVMAVLPGCGVGLGYLLGGEPIGWLLGGPLGWGCLLAGAVLASLGVLWIEALARQAA